MKNKTNFILLLLAATFLLGACGSEATPVPPTVGAPPTLVPAATPTVVPPVIEHQPVGVAVGVGNVLKFYDVRGGFLFEMALPISAKVTAGNVHVAGPYRSVSTYVPVIFHALRPLDALYRIESDGNVERLANVTAVTWLLGAPGQSAYAFGRPGGQALFTGTLEDSATAFIPGLGAPSPLGVRPLELDVDDFKPVGVWFTLVLNSKEPFPVEPRQGLYFTDLISDAAVQILPKEVSPCALSEDRAWVAYTDPATSQLTILNLESKASVDVPWLTPGETTLAGNAAFSLGNTYLAWVESNGENKVDAPGFQATIRVSTLDGSLVTEMPAGDLAVAASFSAVNWAWPVGWLDDQRLVVQVREVDTDLSALVILDVFTGRKMFLASGEFVEFFYP